MGVSHFLVRFFVAEAVQQQQWTMQAGRKNRNAFAPRYQSITTILLESGGRSVINPTNATKKIIPIEQNQTKNQKAKRNMAVESQKAVPLFLFLAIILLILPCAAILWHGNRKFRQQKARKNKRRRAINSITRTMTTSIELGDIRTPPPVVAPPRPRTQGKKLPLAWRGPDGRFVMPSEERSQEDMPIKVAKPISHVQTQNRDVQDINQKLSTPHDRSGCISGSSPGPAPLVETQYATCAHARPVILQPAPKRKESVARLSGVAQGQASFGSSPRVKSQKVQLEEASIPGRVEDDVGHYTQPQVPKGWA